MECPPVDCLRDFSQGLLPEASADEVASHLDLCPDCLSHLDNSQPGEEEIDALLRGEPEPFHAMSDSGFERLQHHVTLTLSRSNAAGSTDKISQQEEFAEKNLEQRTFREYLLLRKLGQGGMGVVYLARHQKLQKLVALKLLPGGWNRNSEMVARFEREMQLIARLDHPRIVRALDAGEWDGHHYLVMEYCEGTNLSEHVRQHGPLSVSAAVDVIRQTAEALEYAHQHGTIHRDIKPSNLLRTPDGTIKLLDLGLALAFGDDTPGDLSMTGMVLGTPDYMAPEQWDRTDVNATADLYALGCTLFFLLTGTAPFADDEHRLVSQKFRGHHFESPPSLTAAYREARREQWANDSAEELPPQLEVIYQGLLQKSSEDRYSSATELLTALDELNANPVPAESSPEGSGRLPLLLLLSGLVAFGSVGAYFAADTWNRESRNNLKRLPDSLNSSDINPLPNNSGLAATTPVPPVVEEIPEPGEENSQTNHSQPQNSPANTENPPGEEPLADLPDEKPMPAPAVAPFSVAEAKAHQEAWAEYLELPVQFTDSLGITFRLIPPGEFQMGCSKEFIAYLRNEGLREREEKFLAPQRRVKLTTPFYMAIHEVTQGLYREVAGTLPPQKFPLGPRYPVNPVTWEEAVRFCNLASERQEFTLQYLKENGQSEPADGIGYRLPTEAEWEFAALAGTTHLLEFDGPRELYEWHDINSPPYKTLTDERTSPVGQLLPNRFGLYDMRGNVFEFCQDWHTPDLPQPAEGKAIVDPRGPAEGEAHALRGGHYGGAIWENVFRMGNIPVYGDKLPQEGFRVVLSVEAVRDALTRQNLTSSIRSETPDE